MSRPAAPWWRLGPAAGPRQGPFWLLAVAWTAAGIALWAGLAAKPWLVSRRPQLVIEAFMGPGATIPQVVSFRTAVEAQPWCCEAQFVDAEEARREAGQDDRVRSMLDAYGGNPFLRSFRVRLCPSMMESWHEAADWMKGQPGVVSVKAPSAQAPKLLENELLLLALLRGSAWVCGGLAVLAALFGLGSLAGGLSSELRVYSELGAPASRRLARAAWALAAPSALIAAAVVTILELATVAGRLSGTWAAGLLRPFPDFPPAAVVLLFAISVALPVLVAAGAALRRH